MECLKDKFVGGALLKGRYQTISPLNHGSFGMVFKAQDLVTNEPVAIKCLTKRSACPDADSDFAIDEKSEEQALHSRLGTHRNIVNLIDSFETDSHIYLVLEFCGQGDLYEAIRKGHGPLETEHVRQFMIELIDAVEDLVEEAGIRLTVWHIPAYKNGIADCLSRPDLDLDYIFDLKPDLEVSRYNVSRRLERRASYM